MKKSLVALLLLFSALGTSAQEDISTLSWKSVAYGMPAEWYGSTHAVQLADTLVRYQTARGGWPKNVKWHREIDRESMRKMAETGIGATIDNGATVGEMRYLAKVYARTGETRFREAFMRGVGYILEAQYDNGGWPQFYPVRPNVAYSGCITYNDDAFLNVMLILRDIRDNTAGMESLILPDSLRQEAGRAFSRGIECILKTQIMVDGEPTVWCAQHDRQTLAPAKARAYELPSFSGAESAGITMLLMEQPDPSPEIVAAVKGAVKWFDGHKIENRKYVRVRGKSSEEVSQAEPADASLVPAEGECVWARFYDLDTGEPFFCDRDGIKRKSIEEIGRERRNGYSWYVSSPAKVLKAYEKWLKRNNL